MRLDSRFPRCCWKWQWVLRTSDRFCSRSDKSLNRMSCGDQNGCTLLYLFNQSNEWTLFIATFQNQHGKITRVLNLEKSWTLTCILVPNYLTIIISVTQLSHIEIGAASIGLPDTSVWSAPALYQNKIKAYSLVNNNFVAEFGKSKNITMKRQETRKRDDYGTIIHT